MTTRPISAHVPEDATATPEEERHRLTLDGLTAIEAGQLVPHADVVAWALALAAVRNNVDQGLADMATGRIQDFDADDIIERGRKLVAARRTSA